MKLSQTQARLHNENPRAFLDGTYDMYDGWLAIDHYGTEYFEDEACFAAWEDRLYELAEECGYDDDGESHMHWSDYAVREYGYIHRVDGLEFRRNTKLFRYAWDEVVRKVWQMLPSFKELRESEEFTMDGDRFSMREVNWNFRTIRHFHEQPTYLTSCAWLRHHLIGFPAEAVCALAALAQCGPDSWGDAPFGQPHLNLACANNWVEFYTLLRCLIHMRKNEGVLWGKTIRGGWTDLMGIEQEVLRNASGRWNVGLPCHPNALRRALPRMNGLDRLMQIAPVVLNVYQRACELEPNQTLELTAADMAMTEGELQAAERMEVRPW